MFQLCLCIRVIGYKVTYFRKNNKTLKMQLSEELIVKNKGATLAMSIAPFLVLEFLSF